MDYVIGSRFTLDDGVRIPSRIGFGMIVTKLYLKARKIDLESPDAEVS